MARDAHRTDKEGGRPRLPPRPAHPHDGRGALDGLRVIDFTRVVSGPFGTQMLGDLGAEIVKIEDPDKGDDTRTSLPRPKLGGESFFYLSLNRNKKSIAIDLKSEAGREVVLDLIATADVLVENFKTPVMKRFGLDYASLSERFPQLIYCSISAYGRTGRLADAGGFDSVIAAEAGVQALMARPGEHPVSGAVPYTDMTAGMNAVIAILAALHARHRLGVGQHLDIAMYDSALANLTFKGYEYLASGTEPALSPRHQAVPRGEFDTADGAICISCGTEKLFRGLCAVVDRPDWLADPRFATWRDRLANPDAFLAEITAVFRTRTSEQWSDAMKEAGLPCGIVRSPGEALLSRESAERGLVYDIPHPTAGSIPAIATPIRMSATPGPVPAHPPLLGEHNDEILAAIGYDMDRIDQLVEQGALGRRVGDVA